MSRSADPALHADPEASAVGGCRGRVHGVRAVLGGSGACSCSRRPTLSADQGAAAARSTRQGQAGRAPYALRVPMRQSRWFCSMTHPSVPSTRNQTGVVGIVKTG
jgi:hypothetical protein